MMKLWLLEPTAKAGPAYDVADGFVVRAETEEDARRLASEQCGGEGQYYWLNRHMSSCGELTACGEARVILRDFVAG